MLFNEIYGNYYNLVAEILKRSVKGDLDQKKMMEIVMKKGSYESVQAVPEALKDKTWPLIKDDWSTPLKYVPDMPLSTLQKRWLKALITDPRMTLFDPDIEGLEDTEPLFDYSDIVYYDRYLDGDPYEDEKYIDIFKTVLRAMKEGRRVAISFVSHRGKNHTWKCVPEKIEYSSKDDKFRIVVNTGRDMTYVNMARIYECSILEEPGFKEPEPRPIERRTVTFELLDERNTLERAMLAFSNHEKQTEAIDDKRYRVNLTYELSDETEILIRILSFGPLFRVTDPPEFIDLIKEMLEMQKSC